MNYEQESNCPTLIIHNSKFIICLHVHSTINLDNLTSNIT